MIHLRRPVAEDGVDIYNLVKQCPPLDQNSRYCNLVQALHFGDTCIIAERSGETLGFITGHLIPARPNTLFVWQVAVSPAARGERLGNAMLDGLLNANPLIEHIETTVTPDNAASTRMFERFAATHDAPIEKSVLFSSEVHFQDQHDDEVLYRIGPFRPSQTQ